MKMTIPALGVDVEEPKRFKKLIRNASFLKRVFTPTEIAYCRKFKDPSQRFAVRFAAKEAIWKAISDELKKNKKSAGHKDIWIQNGRSGKPEPVFSKKLSRFKGKVAVSLSHSATTVVAVAQYWGR